MKITTKNIDSFQVKYTLKFFCKNSVIRKINFDDRFTITTPNATEDFSKIPSFFNELKFFNDLIKEQGQNIANQLYTKLIYEFVPKGETVFSYGELGSKFYVVVKGLVGVKVPFEKEIRTKEAIFSNWKDFLGKNNFIIIIYR